MNRRLFLKFILSVPLLGALMLFVSPLFRYLKPVAGPFPEGMISEPVMPQRIRDISFPLSSFPQPWVVQEFTYEQKNPEFTRQGAQISRIPAYALRIPGKSADDYQFVIYSRICPHMGCIFNYVSDPKIAHEGYNYVPPKGLPVFACPCHLSVYDPLQDQDIGGKKISGKVVSGPAPRPPRQFTFEIDKASQTLVISDLEQGGIA
jgi:Rieske Fe-S protein